MAEGYSLEVRVFQPHLFYVKAARRHSLWEERDHICRKDLLSLVLL